MPQARVPRYQLHKATGQARVTIDGRDHYLGPYDSPESKARYRSLVDRWQLRRRSRGFASLTVGELVLLYDAYARTYYVKAGEPTSEVDVIKAALRPVVHRFSGLPVSEFGPRHLKAVRADMVARGLVRTTVNALVRRVVRLFRWAVAEEYCTADVPVSLAAVPGLRAGRTETPEPDPVGPVPPTDVEATLPLLPAAVRDMVRLQLLSGCRPGEICRLRPCDVRRDLETWEYTPESHKTEHHGQTRRIYFGRQGQLILARYLEDRPPGADCFDPRETKAKKRAGVRYTPGSYRTAVKRACRKAGVPAWSPNRLRHSRATELREQFGLEDARTVLGHAKAATTEIYAERDHARAREIMGMVG